MRVQTLLKEAEWKKLNEIAEKRHLSISAIARSLLCEALDRIKRQEVTDGITI